VVTALGSAAVATGERGIALGRAATATGQYSSAIGAGARATHANSVAIGAGSVSRGNATVALDNTIDTNTTGVVTATISDHDISTLAGLNNSTGNAYTISVTDSSVDAAALNTLDGKTTVNVDAGSVGTLTGTAAAINTTINASTIDTGAAVAVNVNSGSATVAQANSIDAQTTGAVTATISETAISTLSALTGTGNAYSITVNDASVDAAALNTLDTKTTVNVNAGSVGTLTGTAAAIDTAINASTIDTGAAVVVTVSSGSATVAQANSIDAQTTGVVTATISETAISTLSALTGTGNAYSITVTDASVDAAALNSLDGKTTVKVNAGSVGTLTGTAAAIDTAINASTIDTGSAVVVNVNSGSATVAQANSIDAQTTGVVTATISQGDLTTLATLTGTGNAYTVTLSDTTAAASALTTLDGKTTVAVNAGSVTTLSGTAAEVTAAYSANTAGSISGLGDEAVTLSDTTLAATALNTVNSNTSGVVNATSVTTLTGLLADVNTAYAANAANTISGLGDEAVTINNGTGTLLATDLSTAGNATTGTVTVTNTQTVAGTVAEVTAALVTASTKVVMGTASAASISDAATAAQGAPIATTANVTANFSLGIVDSLANLASSGTISSNLSSITADQPAVVLTINNAGGGTMAAADLSAVGNASTGTVTIINIQTVSGTADEVIAAVVTTASKVNLNTGSTINASTYNIQDLSGVDAAFTLNVTTINGAVLDATKLATADSVTLVGTNTATGAHADTLGSRLGGTATLNITTDPITANTDLSDLGSGLSLQFGGDTTAVVTGATLTVRQDQVSGYAISGTGTVAAAGTANSETFDASSITATTNFTSLGGNDRVTMAPSALGSADSIDGGSGSDTLTFSAAGTVVDGAFTYVSSVEVLQLAAGTNSITLGVEAEQAGISTVTGDSGADTLNLLYGTTALTFNAGTGTDTLSYSADSAAQAITLSGISSGTASGSVVNNATDSFTGLEAIVGGSGTGDSITSTSGAEALIVTGANAGTIDGFSFSGVESVDLGAGNDSGTINTGGSLSGSLTFGSGTDTLTYASYGSAVSASLSAANTLTSVTAISGGVTGVDNITLTSSNDTLTVGSSGSLSGNLDFGTGSDTLSYAGNSNAVTVSLNGATSAAAAGATGITGTTSGFETLIGGSGSSDILNATSGGNAISVASNGTTTLDTSLTVSGFETINLGANSDATADTATISGAFSGTMELGDGADTATINNGGSVTSLVGGAGSDTLNLDSANQTITVTGTGAGTSLGSTGGTTTFSGFETVNGLAGNDGFTLSSAANSTITIDGGGGTDSLSVASSDLGNNSLTISGAGSGSLGNVTFAAMESIALSSGNDSASVSSGGSLSGNLDLGAGNNSLTLASGAGSLGSLSAGIGNDTITINGGSVGGNVDLGTGANTLLISNISSSIGGAVTFGSGTSDTLSYAGYGNAVTVSLNSATSTAAAGATGITGAVTGFESLVGGSGNDTLTANAGANTLTVAADGTTTLDINLTVSGFETVNLGASSDTATISGAFSGSIDLGANTDTATIINGGSVTNLSGGTGTDTLNLDGADQTITLTGSGAGTTVGTSGATSTFSSFGSLNALGGTDAFTVDTASTTSITIDGGSGTDSLSVANTDTAANSLTISGAGSGTLGNVTFSGLESVALGSGGDTATVNSGGSLSGNLDLGAGNNTLTLAIGAGSLGSLSAGIGNDTITINGGSVGGAVSVGDGTNQLTVSGTSSSIGSYTGGTGADSITLSGGDVGGNVDLGTGSNSLLISSTSSAIGGAVTFGSGASDSLSYAGYGSAVSLTLSGITSNAGTTTTGGATGISGIASGFESLTGSSNSDSLVASEAGNTLILTGANQGTVDGLSFASFESVDLAGGNDSAQFTSGDSLSGTLAGGSGSDTLDYSGYGSSVNVNLAAGTATGTGGISGFETVLGGASADTITASTSGDVNLQGNAGADTFNVTVAGLTNGDTIDGGADADTLFVTDAGTITDSQFTNITNLETVALTGSTTISAGSEASQAGVATINTGTGATTVNSTATGYDLTVNAANLADSQNLTLSGSANTNDFTVTNLTGSVLAGNTSGTLSVTTGDAIDNAIGVTTGTGATTITADGGGDTVTTDATRLGQNTLLSFFGAAKQVVTNLVGNLTGANLSGTLNVTTADAADNGIDITTGSAATTIAGAAASDTISTNATALAENTSLTLSGSSNEVVTGLVGDVSATALSGTLNVTTADAVDNGISITTGSAATTIAGTAITDTINTYAAALAQNTTLTLSGSSKEVVSNLVGDLSATALSGTLNITTADAGDNAINITTGSAATTIVGSAASDTISANAAALGQNTTLTLSGSSKEVVTNLVGDVSATALSGSLNITTADAGDNGISIATGTAATSIAGTASSDTINTDAAALAQNTTLTLTGSSKEVVTNLVGDINATGLSGTLTVTTGNAADLSISITSGSEDTTINASGTGSGNGNALNFDGSDDYATIPKSIANDFTIEYWVKTSQTSPTGSQWYSGKGIVDAEVGGATTDFGTSLLNNKVAFGVGQSDTTIQSQSSINTGSWTHVAVTRNSSSGSMQIYINGALEASGTGPTGSRSAPNAIAIGSLLNGGSHLNASIDELRLWNTVRSQSDIQAAMNTALTPQSGLVAYYTFNQGSPAGSNAGLSSLTDLSGNGNTGTLYNMALSGSTSNWVAGVVADQIPGAIQVNADQMADNTNLTLTGSNSFTVTNLEANTNAVNATGTVSLAYTDVTDNKATVITGSSTTSVSGTTSGDTLTIDASKLANNSTLTQSGAAQQVVTGLVGDINASALTGTLTVITGDNTSDNGLSIITGNANTTITTSGTSDTVTVNSDGMVDNSTLDLNGSATYTVSNLEADTNAADTTGTVSLAYTDVSDNAAAISTGSGSITVSGTTSGDTLTIDASKLANNTTLSESGAAKQVVTGLVGDINATGLTGTLTVTTADNTNDNGIKIVTGSAATAITGTAATDTISTNAAALAQNTTMTLSGSSNEVVTNLVGDVTASALSGTLNVTTADAGDNAISITTGSAATTIAGSAASDTISTNALALSQNTTLTLSGSSNEVLTNLVGDVSAAGLSGTLTVTTTNAADNGISITTGSGDVVVNGGDATDTITVTGLNTNNQTFTAQASKANFNITAAANNQTLTASNTGSDTIAGGLGTDTLSYAGGSNVDVTISSYSSQAGGSTGQGADTFSGIESLVGATGTDTLRGMTANTDELATVSGANTGTISDAANNGSFSFSSFEQFDLKGGNDTIIFNNNAASISGNLDLGAGSSDTLSYSGYSNVVSVTLSDITNNTGSTAAGGATAITGTTTGFETLVGGGNNADTITDSTGDSTLAITGANSGTIDGMAFSTFENLNLSGGNDTATVSGNGSGLSLYGNLDLGEGTNSLTMNGSAGTVGSVNSGTGTDTFSISAGSVIGAVNASDGSNTLTISGTSSSIGSYLGGSGTDSITLSGGDVVGNVSTTTGNDTLLINSTASTIGGNLDLGGGTGDTLSYVGYSNAVSVTLTDITSNTGSTAAGGATAISGTATGFENLIGGSSSSDSVTDSTGDSTIVISGPNSGTIDGLAFSSIEYLNLSTGIDGVTVQSGGSLSGNLDLADGSSNSLLMNSGAGSIASVSSTSGNDTFTLDGGSVTGSITAGDGSNSLTINNTNSSIGSYTGGSGIDTIESKGGDLGAVSTGSAADSVTLSLGAVITGAVTLGANTDTTDGIDSLTLNASTITGNVNTGSGSDGVSVLTTSTITGNVTLGTNSDSVDGADSLTVTGTSSSSKSVITGSITTGAGGDSLNLTNATIGGAGQTITLGSDNNGLDGNDSLIASGTAITAAITTGSGADSLTLSASSSVTGNVSLGIDGDTPAITDSFDSLSGWTGGTLETSSSYYGNFLGRYSNGSKTNGQDVSKSFTLNSQPATLSFDFIKLDSWDAENFRAYINDTVAFTGNFRYDQAISSTSGTTNGFSWTIAPKDSFANNGFSSWQDQIGTVTISLPSGYSNVKIGFGSDLNSDASDESYGIDNLSIIQSNINSTDTLTLNASTITGNVTTGSGADGVSVLSGSKITGSVNLGSNSDVKDSGDSLTVTGVPSGTKSEITGSITTGGGADTLTLTDATIGGAGQTISLGSDNNSNDGNDALNASGTAITAAITTGSGSDSISLSVASSVAGHVTLGSDGDTTNGNADILTLNASTISGNVVTGSGADGVSVLNTSTITGNVTLGSNSDSADSGDTLTVTGASSSSKSVVTGSIATGAGADSLTLTNATIGGAGQTISLGTDSNSLDGNDLLSASGTAITATITGGSGADELTLSAASTVSGNINLGIDGDTTTASNGDSLSLDASNVTGNVTTGSGADAVSVLNTSKITGNVTLGSNTDSADGADSLTVTGASSSSKSEITGSITTGGGADILTLTNATIGSAGQTISLGSDTNALEGNDRLNASGTSITANITTGSGSDILSLSAGSSVTGDVTLGSVGDNQAIIDFANTVTDSFDTASGWSGGTVDSTNSYFGSFLGRYAAGTKTNGQDVYKSFSLSNSPATISFDLIKLDSWDGESFKAFINDTEAFSRTFTSGGISSGSGTTNGFSWTIAPKDSLAGYGFAGWSDQTATITITLPASYTNFNKLGFGSTLDQGISDESYGIDNLTIIPTIVSHDDSLTLDASSITGNVTTGSAADTVRVLNASTITGNVTLGSNTDSTDGVDTLTVTGASSSSKSVITGSIATGAGADILTLTNATIGAAGQTISLGSDSNSLDGNDSLNATGTAITAAITAGSGSDTLTLSAGSSVTGDVSLGANADNETVNEAFDSLSGWTGGALNSSSSYFGSFLGRYGNGSKTNGQDVSKSFTLSSQPATISFDFIKFDTWDGEAFTAYINDTAAFTSSFRYGQSISSASGSTNGFSWTIAPKDSLGTHGFGGWENQTASITITLPTSYANFNKLGFGSNLDEGISNESYGIDNLTITPIILSNDDGLSLDASSITGNVTTGTANDTVTLSNSSTITGSVNLGSNTDAIDGNDSLTLSSGSNIVGNVDFGAANDTLTLTTGISSATTIKGDVAFGVGNADTISYSGNAGPITIALNGISADAVGSATGAYASYVTGDVTGFESIVGSDYSAPTSSGVTGDTIYDNTGASLVVLSGANAGTIDNLDFSSIENLQLRSGADTLSFQGSSGAPGLIAGRADGGGVDGATYTNGVYAGGTQADTGIDLLDYTAYQVSTGASVDLSQNKATGVFGGAAGGLISGNGSIATTTTDSSFENVDGSRFNDTIIGDDQTSQANVLRGFDGADTIKGLAGNDVLDGGNGVGSNITDGADTIQGGDGADTILGSFGNDSISGGSFESPSDDSIDTLTYSATSISSARIEGLDISLVGTDTGTVLGDANSSLTVGTFTSTYNPSISQQLISAPTNQVSNDWTQSYTDIQNLVLSEQSDILRIDTTDVSTGSIDAKGGNLDTLNYSSFDSESSVVVNLSGAAYSFNFDSDPTIDADTGEIELTNAYSATNINIGEPFSQGGANGVAGFEVVIGGAADDAFVGNASDNLLAGNAGDDRIDGGAGNDTIYGGTGDDYIIPGEGADYIDAGAGINTIIATSSDIAYDYFNPDPNGVNEVLLQGNGTDKSTIVAPTGYWNPGAQGIDVLNGGDPTSTGGTTTYDTVEGTGSNDTYLFGGVAFKNVSDVKLGAGSDSVGTAAITKGSKVNYDGGSGSVGGVNDIDKVTLNFTFDQLARLNVSGTFVKDVQNYLDDPNGKTFSSTQADFTANNFESGTLSVITPGVQNALQGDPAAVTINSAYGAINSTITSADDVNLSTSALTTSGATALSVSDIVSAIVQASGVKGSDAITVTSGGNTTGSTTASQDASAVSRTADDRADSVISAYGIGTDRSSFTAGQNLTLNLSGNVTADTSAESLGFVVNASGIVETAGSRDSSLTAAEALSLTISGNTDQTVRASNVEGLAVASLASRTYGIDDANLTDSTADSIQAGTDVSLQATANSSNRVTAQTVGNESLGTITFVNRGAAATDRFTTTQIGVNFPLINGDRVRFSSSNGGVQADRDYYVLNVMPVTGEFQLSSEPNGSPIDVPGALNATGSLQAYRPAVATADAFSTVTGVDLNRTGSGVQAGDSLTLRSSAADALAASAISVAGDATAGVFRLGGMDGLNLPSEVATIQGLVDTASVAGSSASFTIKATDSTTLTANTTEGAALTEANIQVLGSKSSASTAGDDLSLNTQAALTVSGSASSTAGSAEARSGAGAGSGVTTAGVSNVLPNSSSYAKVTGLADGTQTAGADLAVQSTASTTLNATASTVSGSETLGSLWISSRSDNILATFNLNDPLTPSFVGPQYLAAGQVVQLDTSSATATGLSADTDYAVKLLGFGAVNDAADTLTMPTGITYQAGDAIRFRLNSSTAPNTSENRYGLALGTTYYVKTVTGTTFTLAASLGGAAINLSADSLGPADQLVDADRFQLLTPPAAAGGTYTVAVLTPTVPTDAAAPASVSLTLPSVANAFAGSREADRTLNTSDSLNLAQVSGITGNSGLRSLISGAQSAISAVANGVLNAFANNTGNDATASAGLVAEGLKDTAIIAGSTGTLIADASITGVADASTIGNIAALDSALADLTITARGLTASNAANDITIGGNGDVEASATLAGRSSASTVTGDSDALANLQADALRLDVGNTISIADQGSVNATASIGNSVAPLLVSAVSAGSGDASSQMGLEISGILGSSPTTGTFSSIAMGGGSLGTLDASGEGVVDLSATATNGNSSINLGSTSGGGIATITGMRNTALNVGADLAQIDATASGFAKLSALSVAGNATVTAASSSYGILSDTGSQVGITLADQGQIAVLANQKSVASATSVAGQASSSLSGSSVAIDSLLVNLGSTGQVRVEAVTDLLNRAESVSGSANA
jgi:hypothetical protein